MKLVLTASAIIFFFVPHLIADAIFSSVTADAGYYGLFGVHKYKCYGDGVTNESCAGGRPGPRNTQASADGFAGVYFPGSFFGAYLNTSQGFYSYGALTFADVQTTAGLNVFGVASGGVGPGTLTYDISIHSECDPSPTGCFLGPAFPSFVAPGILSSVPCPVNDATHECFEGIVNFTFGVPFPLSFEMSMGWDVRGAGYNVEAFQYLEFGNMTVSGTGTNVNFSLAPDVPEVATFRLGFLGLFSTAGLIALRRHRYFPIDE